MLGSELRRARLRAGLTQDELAYRAKLSRPYVSQLENDKKSPTLDVFLRLCKALAVKPSALIAKIER